MVNKEIKISAILLSAIILFGALSETTLSNERASADKRAKDLYIQQCAKCHRNNGSGIKRIYPPLKNADYIRNNSAEELLRGMLFGRSGKIVVNGVEYNGVMTTEIDGSLSDEDIALILNYVYFELNSINTKVTAKDVREARKKGKLPEHK